MIFNTEKSIAVAAARKLKLLLLDVDGVLTDGKLYFATSGEEIKAFHSLDGHGIKMLMSTGVEVGIITGRTSTLLEKRACDLGIKLLIQGREDKLNVLTEIMANKDLHPEEVGYAGDDLPDLPVLQVTGSSFSVPHGHASVKSSVQAVTETDGGNGAVREITDFILKAQGNYEHFLKI
jgi:3-deoxy-D-manno-octulosonate 8-phosphate phosphatase (KDO 8-P phosphatase)|tara:strand:+ start:247 stop:780 length:534 start_codon:yes stop_codon:yes gene_type:complete